MIRGWRRDNTCLHYGVGGVKFSNMKKNTQIDNDNTFKIARKI